MTRKEKIKKLDRLGIYDLWENNVRNHVRMETDFNVTVVTNELLDMDVSWALFLSMSFVFSTSMEGNSFWLKIAMQS